MFGFFGKFGVLCFLETCLEIRPFALLPTKLTILLSLTSAARASEIVSLDIRYLISILLVILFILERMQKYPRDLNLAIQSSFIFLKKIKVSVSANVTIYTLKGQRKYEDKIHSPV